MFGKKLKEDTTHLRELESLIKERVKGNIVKHEVKPLTAFGENFGSEILSVDITVDENGKQKTLYAVAKLLPPTEAQQEMFNVQTTYKNEIALYTDIVPALQELQRENGFSKVIDYFPELYGSRISLDKNQTEVDFDAVILLENLKVSGFTNVEREIGFDLDASKRIIKSLANFHATAVGLKIKKPNVFGSRVKPFLSGWKEPKPPPGEKNPFLEQLEIILLENPATATLIPKARSIMSKPSIRKVREPWATVIHCDLWVNNIMIKAADDQSDGIKFVDFQVIDFGSPLSDLLFFLFSSAQTPVLKYHFDKLIMFYYNEFIKNLKQLRIDTKDFSYEMFEEELRLELRQEISHSVVMLMIVLFGPKEETKVIGKVPEWNPHLESNGLMKEVTPQLNHQNPHGNHQNPHGPVLPKIPFKCKEKIWCLFEEVNKKHWL